MTDQPPEAQNHNASGGFLCLLACGRQYKRQVSRLRQLKRVQASAVGDRFPSSTEVEQGDTDMGTSIVTAVLSESVLLRSSRTEES